MNWNEISDGAVGNILGDIVIFVLGALVSIIFFFWKKLIWLFKKIFNKAVYQWLISMVGFGTVTCLDPADPVDPNFIFFPLSPTKTSKFSATFKKVKDPNGVDYVVEITTEIPKGYKLSTLYFRGQERFIKDCLGETHWKMPGNTHLIKATVRTSIV